MGSALRKASFKCEREMQPQLETFRNNKDSLLVATQDHHVFFFIVHSDVLASEINCIELL